MGIPDWSIYKDGTFRSLSDAAQRLWWYLASVVVNGGAVVEKSHSGIDLAIGMDQRTRRRATQELETAGFLWAELVPASRYARKLRYRLAHLHVGACGVGTPDVGTSVVPTPSVPTRGVVTASDVPTPLAPLVGTNGARHNICTRRIGISVCKENTEKTRSEFESQQGNTPRAPDPSELLRRLREVYPPNGSSASPEVERELRLIIARGDVSGDRLIQAARDYAAWWRESDPGSYPGCAGQLANWLYGRKYEMDWANKKRMAKTKAWAGATDRHVPGPNSPYRKLDV